MNSRERLQMALNHQEPDHIPFDLGATVLTSLSHFSYTKLRRHLGLPVVKPAIVDIFQQIVAVDEDMRTRLQCDVRDVAPRSSASFRIDIKEDMPGYTNFTDEWGIGWKMPKDGGFYYDMYRHPLAGDLTRADIDKYPWPDPTDPARFAGLRERARQAAEVEQQGVILGGLCAGIMEMTAWTRGFADYFADFGNNPDRMGYLLDKFVELKMAYWDIALREAGDYADAVVEADDMAGQFSMLISPATYRKLVKPRHKKLIDFIKSRSRAKVFFHSCGSIRKVIPDLIDVGVDILNPVQVNAASMDSAELKREFGRDITFWGGAIDTQAPFWSGEPNIEAVKADTKRRIDDLGPGGGFVFSAIHNIQANVPPENIMAWWETWRDYGVYRK